MFSFLAAAEKIVGLALSYHLMQNTEADPKDAKLVLSTDRHLHKLFFFFSFSNDLSHVIQESFSDESIWL